MTTMTMTAAETRVVFPDSMTLREARAAYFARTGFDDATYRDPWVKLPVGPIHVYMPNVGPRKEAVKVHDLNHIVSGYGTNWAGECEISAFEIGMGTGRYWFGWFLDVGGLAMGLMRAPKETLTAFARGRRAKDSVYRIIPTFSDQVLDESVGSLRSRLQLEDAPEATAEEKRSAFFYASVGVFLHLGLPAIAVASLLALAIQAL